MKRNVEYILFDSVGCIFGLNDEWLWSLSFHIIYFFFFYCSVQFIHICCLIATPHIILLLYYYRWTKYRIERRWYGSEIPYSIQFVHRTNFVYISWKVQLIFFFFVHFWWNDLGTFYATLHRIAREQFNLEFVLFDAESSGIPWRRSWVRTI